MFSIYFTCEHRVIFGKVNLACVRMDRRKNRFVFSKINYFYSFDDTFMIIRYSEWIFSNDSIILTMHISTFDCRSFSFVFLWCLMHFNFSVVPFSLSHSFNFCIKLTWTIKMWEIFSRFRMRRTNNKNKQIMKQI